MLVYRIAHPTFCRDLSGEGARLFGGRWNKKGISCLYTAEHPALALLELAVHYTAQSLPEKMNMVLIEVPDDLNKENELKPETDELFENRIYSLEMGSNWLLQKSSLILKVPSVLCPKAFNILINPAHETIQKIQIVEMIEVIMDGRIKA
jgi:RES domain-containing protein